MKQLAAEGIPPPAASWFTNQPDMPARDSDQPALQQGSAEQAGSSQQLVQPLVQAALWARRPENSPRRLRRAAGAVPQQAGSAAPQAGSAAQHAGSAAAQAGSAAAQPGSVAQQAGSAAQLGAQSQQA
jgi:hypothetical protein